MRRFYWVMGLLLVMVLVRHCGEEKTAAIRVQECPQCRISRIDVEDELVSLPLMGDIWTSTWAQDDALYLAFGDATGMGDCLPTLLMDEPDEFDAEYHEIAPGCFRPKNPNDNEYCEVFDCSSCLPLCPYTSAGLVRLTGDPPRFSPCLGKDQCVVSRHIPYGSIKVFEHNDKPSSLLYLRGRFYMPMHYPPGHPTVGYLAYSDDGRTWNLVRNSPWRGDSPFRVMMFINQGKNYSDAREDYIYGLGIGDEVADLPERQKVYLCRVPLPSQHERDPKDDPVLQYDAYEYFAGLDASGRPQWDRSPDRAVPVEGLETMAQGMAVYHPSLDRYLFVSGFLGTMSGRDLGLDSEGEHPVGALFEARRPWGPWYRAGVFPGGFIAGILPKGLDDDGLYLTASGGGGVTYNLNIRRIRFSRRPQESPPLFRVVTTQKVEQIIGDIDFETLSPTRQKTATRYNVEFTDLGVPVEYQGKLWFLFGDTDPEAEGWDERHDDTFAFTEAQRAEDLSLTFLMDPQRGRGVFNPIIACPQEGKDDCVDLGALNVPVAGLGDDQTLFVWFTADAAGKSLLARSDDGGRHFDKVYDFGTTHFIDLAVERFHGPIPGLDEKEREWVLIFGSGNHDHPHVYLAATPLSRLRQGDRAAVRFLSAIEETPTGDIRLSWSDREDDAVPIFGIEQGKGPGIMSEVPHAWGFGEPLVHYDRTLGIWMATYNVARKKIALRTSRQPWGPFSEPIVLFDPAFDYGRGPAYGRYIGDDRTEHLGGQGELYGPYIIHRFTRVSDDGRVHIYWLLSTWQPYTVVLMKSVLEFTERGASSS